MRFAEALVQMQAGRAVRIPNWGGYWTWSQQHQTITMHIKDGSVMDIRQSPNIAYTLSFICRDDWEVVEDVRDTHHYTKRGSFQADIMEHESFAMTRACMQAFQQGKVGRTALSNYGPLQQSFHAMGVTSKNINDLMEDDS